MIAFFVVQMTHYQHIHHLATCKWYLYVSNVLFFWLFSYRMLHLNTQPEYTSLSVGERRASSSHTLLWGLVFLAFPQESTCIQSAEYFFSHFLRKKQQTLRKSFSFIKTNPYNLAVLMLHTQESLQYWIDLRSEHYHSLEYAVSGLYSPRLYPLVAPLFLCQK